MFSAAHTHVNFHFYVTAICLTHLKSQADNCLSSYRLSAVCSFLAGVKLF